MATFDRYNQFSIPEVSFAGPIPETKTVTFEAPDASILASSLQQQERRQTTFNEAKQNFDEAFAQARQALATDDETSAWFEGRKQQILSRIKERVDYGDYYKAFEIATQEAKALQSDPEYVARVASYKEYQDAVKRVTDDATLDKTAIDQWVAMNPYSFKPKLDNNGNVISFEHFSPNAEYGFQGRPRAKVDWQSAEREILGVAQPQSLSSTTGRSNSSGYAHTGSYGAGSSSSTESSTQSTTTTVKLPVETIYANMVDWATRNSDDLLHELYVMKRSRDALLQEKQTASADRKAQIDVELENYSKYFDNTGNFRHLYITLGKDNNGNDITRDLSVAESYAYLNLGTLLASAARNDRTTSNVTSYGRRTSQNDADEGQRRQANAAEASAQAAQQAAQGGYIPTPRTTNQGTGNVEGNNQHTPSWVSGEAAASIYTN